MKLILFSIFFSTLFFGQTKLTVQYQTQTIIKAENINYGDFNVPEAQKQMILDKLKSQKIPPTEYILNYYNGDSYFENIITPDKNDFWKRQKVEYYKVKNKNGYYELYDYIVEKFIGQHNYNPEIEYKEETQEIEKYSCKLAIVKLNNIVSKVWYTENIPTSTGPFNYTGFPGLVLKVETPNRVIYATKITNDCKPEAVKKIDKKLPVYEGTELELKKEEANKKLKEYRKTEIGKQGDLFKNRF